MEPFVLKNHSYLSIETWEKQFPCLSAGMTTKNGGHSKGDFTSLNLGLHVGDAGDDVILNRQTVSELLGFPLTSWVGAEQIHDVVIKKIAAANSGAGASSYDDSIKGTDGFYTNEAGVLLTMCFADCVPLFFIAPSAGMIGIAHAGWKGTVRQIAAEMINVWEKEGVSPEQIFVAIGPSICEKCYIVDDYVINLVEKILEDVDRKPYNLISKGQYSLNLRELNRLVLLKAGVPNENISTTGLCSSCDHGLFFSHRRDLGRTGRMAGYIGWMER